MEGTAAAQNALNIPANLTTQKMALIIKPHNFLNFTSSSTILNPRNKTIPLFLTHCSTKPNTNNRNATDEDKSTPQSLQDSKIQPQAIPASAQAISSSNPSFSRGLIFDLGPKNSWDSLEIGSPVVKRYLSDEEERWCMWYHGRCIENPDCDSIGLAVSSNGVHWDRGGGPVSSNSDVGLVMNPSKDWWAFDTHSIRPSEVLIMSSTKIRTNSAVYWLYYTGYCSETIDSSEFRFKNGENGRMHLKSLPGLAMSQDGRHWARIEGEHHSGALLDVGADREWDSLFIASVFHESGDLRMYYHSFNAGDGHFSIGIARSRDGMRWLKLGKILSAGPNGAFDEGGGVNPRVLRNRKDGKYLMVYEGVGGDGRRSIGLAVSSDGLKDWSRVKEGSPMLEQSEDGGWDCEGVGYPCLVQMDGESEEWRLYYRGIGKGGRTGIGLAVCRGIEDSKFERWIGFHL